MGAYGGVSAASNAFDEGRDVFTEKWLRNPSAAADLYPGELSKKDVARGILTADRRLSSRRAIELRPISFATSSCSAVS